MQVVNENAANPEGFWCWLGCTGYCTVVCAADTVSPVLDITAYAAGSSTFFYY